MSGGFALAVAHLGVLRVLELGDFGGALAQWRQACEWLPHNAEAHYQLGMALDQVGQSEEAIAQFKQALKLEPPALAPRRDMILAALGHDLYEDSQIPQAEILKFGVEVDQLILLLTEGADGPGRA